MSPLSLTHTFLNQKGHIYFIKQTTKLSKREHNEEVVYSDIFKVLGVQKAYFHSSLNVDGWESEGGGR